MSSRLNCITWDGGVLVLYVRNLSAVCNLRILASYFQTYGKQQSLIKYNDLKRWYEACENIGKQLNILIVGRCRAKSFKKFCVDLHVTFHHPMIVMVAFSKFYFYDYFDK